MTLTTIEEEKVGEDKTLSKKIDTQEVFSEHTRSDEILKEIPKKTSLEVKVTSTSLTSV